MQVRNKSNSSFEAVLDEILAKTDASNYFISKVVRLKDGIDLYMSSNRFILALGKTLSSKYGAELKTSRKLFSRDRQSGKQLWRVTVLIRLPQYNIGDVVRKGPKIAYISGINKLQITAIDLKTGKKCKIRDPDSIIKPEEYLVAQVSKTKPRLEVLDPETFQSVAVANPKEVTTEKVMVLRFDNQLYILPNGASS